MQRRLGIGKRTEPVVRRHLAAPCTSFSVSLVSPIQGGKKQPTFPFLLLFVSTPRVSIPRRPTPNRHCCFLVRKSRRRETIVYDLTYLSLFHHVYLECLSILQWRYLAMNLRFSYDVFLPFLFMTTKRMLGKSIFLSVNNHQKRREAKRDISNTRDVGETNTGG